MSNWDWLAKAAIACWAISIAGKLLIMVAGEMSLIRRPNFVGVFDLTGLVAVALTVSLILRWIFRRFERAN